MSEAPRAVLALCLGNICRSPIAEGLLRHHCALLKLELEIDSAGTGGYHVGEAPDPRSVEVMRLKGHDIREQRARKLTLADLEYFDLILAMDTNNVREASRLTNDPRLRAKVLLLDPEGRDVPDPYYGGPNGFLHIYEMIDKAVSQRAKSWVK